MQTVTMSNACFRPPLIWLAHISTGNALDYSWFGWFANFGHGFGSFQFSSVWFSSRFNLVWFGLVWYGLVWFVRLACRCRLHLFVIIHAFVCYFNDCVWFMSFDVHSFFARLPVWLLLLLLVGQLHVIGLHGRTLSSQAQRILSWFLRLVARLYRLLPLVNYATHENK